MQPSWAYSSAKYTDLPRGVVIIENLYWIWTFPFDFKCHQLELNSNRPIFWILNLKLTKLYAIVKIRLALLLNYENTYENQNEVKTLKLRLNGIKAVFVRLWITWFINNYVFALSPYIIMAARCIVSKTILKICT